MAVKLSGQLSLRYDIAAEVNGASSNISLRGLSAAAGFSTQDAMSEFYGYSATPPNNFYWQGRDTFFMNQLQQPQGTFYGGVTLMAWFKSNVTTLKNQRLFAIGANNRFGRNEFRVHYIASLNRISLEVWDASGIRRIRRQYPLHSGGNNASVTGVTSSRTGWTRDQPGNVDPTTGLAHITATWDGPGGGGLFSGLRLYWRGVELTYSVNNNSTSTLTSADGNYIALRNNVEGGANASTFDGWTDNFGAFSRALTGAEVLSVFNNGNINVESAAQSAGIGTDADLAYYQGFEGSLTAEEGGAVGYTLQLNGSNGAFTSY